MAAAATEAPIALGRRLASVLLSLRTATPETPPAELTRLQSELRAVATEIRERSQNPADIEAVLARSVLRNVLHARAHPHASGQTDRTMLRYAAGDLSAHYAQHRDALASQSISAGNVATTASAVSARDHSAITAPPPLFQDPNRTFVVIGEQPGLAEKLRLGGGSVTTQATADSAMQNTIVVLDLALASTTIDILRYGRCGAMVVSSGACASPRTGARVCCALNTQPC